eukprot:6196945-Pleurochrysis_carterae.AAC.1
MTPIVMISIEQIHKGEEQEWAAEVAQRGRRRKRSPDGGGGDGDGGGDGGQSGSAVATEAKVPSSLLVVAPHTAILHREEGRAVHLGERQKRMHRC